MKSIKHAINNITNEDFWNLKNGTCYFGIDPTAPAMHIGHLISIKILLDLYKKGFKIIILIGGFTGQIGDPTGKLETRQQLNNSITEKNAEGLISELKKIFQDRALFVNNKDWLDHMTLKEYFSLIGSNSVNHKLKQETFANRLKENKNLSLREFCYPDIQAIDFYILNQKYGCNIQLGGADQWGNIAFGVSFVQSLIKDQVFGLCTKLITDEKGEKLGKSTGKPPFMNNLFNVYQYFINSSSLYLDQLAELFFHKNYMKLFLNFSLQEKINAIFECCAAIYYGDYLSNYENNILSNNSIAKVFVDDVYNKTKAFFEQNILECNENFFEIIFVTQKEANIINILKKANLAQSNSEAKRQILEKITVEINNAGNMEKKIISGFNENFSSYFNNNKDIKMKISYGKQHKLICLKLMSL